MNLECPKCGFNFGFNTNTEVTPEELEEIKTCPCGAMMKEVETLKGIVIE
jgi:hypothetical protein